ncbi:MAG: hypothetical protein ABIO83_01870 [Ilumatobacteraceae bacterium]
MAQPTCWKDVVKIGVRHAGCRRLDGHEATEALIVGLMLVAALVGVEVSDIWLPDMVVLVIVGRGSG